MGKKEEVSNHPWLSIWIHPRNTIRSIVTRNPSFRFVVLSFFYGFPFLLHLAQVFSLGASVSTLSILIASLILAPFVGMLGITIIAGLVLWTGKWLGGSAPFSHIRAAVAWGNVTNVVTSVIWLILVGYFGLRVFFASFPSTPFFGREMALISCLFLLQFILAVWSVVIISQTIGEVQGFSAWKGLLNIVIPFVIFVVVMTVLLMMLPAMPA